MSIIEKAMNDDIKKYKYSDFSECKCKELSCTECYPISKFAPRQSLFTIDNDNSAALDEALRLNTELSLKITQLEIKIRNLETEVEIKNLESDFWCGDPKRIK